MLMNLQIQWKKLYQKQIEEEKIQEEYNKEHNITPKTIQKSVRDIIKASIVEDISGEYNIDKNETTEDIINKLTSEMLKAAQAMEFEKAAELRDKIKGLENSIN